MILKKLVLMIVIAGFITVSFGQSVHSLTIRDIDGVAVQLSTLQSKKTLFLIAPFHTADSVEINRIALFEAKYRDSLNIVGIMSIEDGYADSNKTKIRSLYAGRGVHMLLTEGMYIRKEAGANQSLLMKWLTTASLNTHIDSDVEGIGQKFFVDKNGELFSVLIPQILLDSPPVIINIRTKSF